MIFELEAHPDSRKSSFDINTRFTFQLETLQAENASEWCKRERLETDKISLERDNKKLKNEIRELQERAEARRGRPVSTVHSDASQLQQDLADRNKVH